MKKVLSVVMFLCLAISIASCAAAEEKACNTVIDGNIKSLSIDAASGKVNVYSHNKPSVEIYATEEFKLTNMNGRVEIKFPKMNKIFSFSNKEISVYLPSNLSLDSLEIDVASATVTIDRLSAREIEIESASGSINVLNTLIAKEVSIHSSSGALKINDINAEEVSFDTSSGSIHASFTKLPRDLEIDSSSGSVELKVPKDAGISLKLKQASGSFNTNLPFMQPVNAKNSYILGNGSSNVSIETSSGSVKIESL